MFQDEASPANGEGGLVQWERPIVHAKHHEYGKQRSRWTRNQSCTFLRSFLFICFWGETRTIHLIIHIYVLDYILAESLIQKPRHIGDWFCNNVSFEFVHSREQGSALSLRRMTKRKAVVRGRVVVWTGVARDLRANYILQFRKYIELQLFLSIPLLRYVMG